MALVEEEQGHRHYMERTAISAEMWDTLGGKLLGALMTLAAIGACIWSILLGAHWAVSIAIVGVPITALIGKFLNKDK